MRRTAALLTALVLTTGCTGGPDEPDEPDVPAIDDFADGTCSTVAGDVRAVGLLLPRVGDGPEVDMEVLDALRAAQDGLRAVAEGAEPDLQEPLKALSQSIGFIRIRGVGNMYEPFIGEDAQKAYERVVEVCTG